MLAATLELFKDTPYFIVAEEEATDNFANNGHIQGTLEALKRADETIGFLWQVHQQDPRLLVLTASDSDAGDLQARHLMAKNANDATRWPVYTYNSPKDVSSQFTLQTIGDDDYAGGSLVRSTHVL